MTNKHFFEEHDYTNEINIKNGKYNMKGKLVFMSPNLIDIAIIELVDKKYLSELVPIKIKNNKINLLQEAYAINYSYFDLTNVVQIKKPFKGVVTKISNFEKLEIIYQVDCSCYSGGSGGPIVDKHGYLIGILFENLSFQDKNTMLQIPKSGVILGRDVIKLTIDAYNSGKIKDLWIYKLSDSQLDEYFNYQKYSPKF